MFPFSHVPFTNVNNVLKDYAFKMVIISFDFIPLLWRSRHLYDRRTEEILQCNEKTGIQKTTKTYTTTRGKNVYVDLSKH